MSVTRAGRLRVCLGVKKIQVPEPVKFVLVESGIRNKAQGFHLKKTGIQYLESGMREVESRIQDCLGFPYMRRVFREGGRK